LRVPDETQQAEAARILEFFGDRVRAYDVVEGQLQILTVRTQVLLSLSGIVITVTGFSGTAMARSGEPGPILIVLGLAAVLAGASVAVMGVLRLSWLSQRIGSDPQEAIASGIALRDAKARHLQVAMSLFVAGFALYCAAIANMLLRA
jgi:phage gp37-like protein